MEESFPPPDTLDGHCLAEEVLYALACGGLEAKERSKALAHLDECEVCQALLADEVRGLPEFSAPGGEPGLPTLIQLGALIGDRYRIRRLVARGGMGEVYEAWDGFLSERVAFKTINPLAASGDQSKASARFKQEVQLSRRVADPHVCRIHEFGQHLVRGFGPLSYLTMEFIEGQTLGARLRKGPRLRLDEVVVLSRQMLRGLAAAHGVGVLHRDFKSDNVMLRSKSTSPEALHAVIMDFGLARLLGDQAHWLTERHELVGSAAYMAPEQLEDGASLSEATDVYAFGVVVFEMLTGRLPFDGKSAVAVAMRRLTHKAPAPSTCVAGLSAGWDALVAGCLEREVARRFASTAEVATRLEALARDSAVSPRPRLQRRAGLALAGVSGAALLAGVVYVASPWGRAPAPVVVEARRVALALEPAPPAQPSLSERGGGTPGAGSGAPVNTPERAQPPGPAAPSAVSEQPPSPASHVPAPAPKTHANTVKRSATRAALPTPAAPAAAVPTADRPEDVRDVFFLEGPSGAAERDPQNSTR